MQTKKVLILGGGFAGLEAAIQLRKKKIDVTLVSEREYIFIYPTSIWIPVGTSSFEKSTLSLEKLSRKHKFEFIQDSIDSIQSKDKTVHLKNTGSLSYEYLIIAIGAGKVKPPGVDHTNSICASPDQHLQIKEKFDELVKKGSGRISVGFAGNPKDPSALRGGPAFELIFNIHHQLKKKKLLKNFELSFYATMPRPGARMGPKSFDSLNKYFTKLGINKYFGKKIKEFKEGSIVFEDDSGLESDLTIFTAPLSGHPVLKKSDLPLNEAGFVKINDYCEVMHDFDTTPEKYNVFVIGDAAALDGPDWRAKQGHIAEAMAKVTAYNIVEIEKDSIHRHGYFEHLNIICIMDTGNGAIFVKRSDKGGTMIPMPGIGHLMKKGWGWYYKNTKLKRIPRLPHM